MYNYVDENGVEYIGELVNSRVSAAEKKVNALYKLGEGITHSFETDTTAAYSKPVPVGARLTGVKKIGGRTICFNQLFDPSFITAPITQNGITVTNNGGVYTVEGTVENSSSYCNINYTDGKNNCCFFKNHKYLSRHNSDSGNLWITLCGTDADNNSVRYAHKKESLKNLFFTVDREIVTSWARIQYTSNVGTAISETITPILFDLTKMFGAGNEPETVEEFEAMFPDTYYPYSEGELMASPVTALHSTIDGRTVERTQIPDEVLALEGYGDGINADCCNYVDFEAKTYHKCVGAIDLGVLSWSRDGSHFYANIPKLKLSTSANTNGVCLKYDRHAINWKNLNDKEFCLGQNITGYPVGADIAIFDEDYTNGADFKAAMSGVILYYELAEPVVTDISDMLTTDFNILDVMPNGQLTFENENKIVVPSNVEYIVSLAEVLNDE